MKISNLDEVKDRLSSSSFKNVKMNFNYFGNTLLFEVFEVK
jgi:hypothetical protein